MLRSKLISISNPQKQEDVKGIASNVILVSKYSFEAESTNELSMKKGEIFKLINRPGNGWLLVKFIDKLAKPGLIPASYVDIAINDQVNPVTLKWLQGSDDLSSSFDNSNYLEVQVRNLMKMNAPMTINNRAYPVFAEISNVLMSKGRYWYRVDVVLSTRVKVYLCRYYQHFFKLQFDLLDTLGKKNKKIPRLPEPIAATSVEDGVILKRSKELNEYLNNLISDERIQFSKAFIDWLDTTYEDLPGFETKGQEMLIDEEINRRLSSEAESVTLTPDPRVLDESFSSSHLENSSITTEEEDKKTEEEKKLEEVDLPQRSHSKNTYNHYHQVAHFEKMKERRERDDQSLFRSGSKGRVTYTPTLYSNKWMDIR